MARFSRTSFGVEPLRSDLLTQFRSGKRLSLLSALVSQSEFERGVARDLYLYEAASANVDAQHAGTIGLSASATANVTSGSVSIDAQHAGVLGLSSQTAAQVTRTASHAGLIGLESSGVLSKQGTADALHAGSLGFTSQTAAQIDRPVQHSGNLGLSGSIGAVLGDDLAHVGTLGLSGSASAVIGKSAQHSGALGFSSDGTFSVAGQQELQHGGNLGFSSSADASVDGLAAQRDGGGSYSLSESDYIRRLPKFLRKRYEKETPQAEVAKRITRAISKTTEAQAAEAVTERGIDALGESHTLYLGYVAHLLTAWQVPALDELSNALVNQILEAGSKRERIAAAQALAREIDEQDVEALLLTLI